MAKEISNKKEIFETMPVTKAVASMAGPTIISQLVHLIYNIADTFFVGRTGNSYMIASMSVTSTIYLLCIAFANLFGVGGGSLIARLKGRGEDIHARAVSAFSIWGGILLPVLYAVIIGVFMNSILYFLGASDQSIPFARQYCIYVIILGGIPIVDSLVAAHILRNVGYAKKASFGLSLGAVLNMSLDPLFMFVLLPEGYEVMGAAIATTLSNWICTIYLFVQMHKVSEVENLSLKPSDIRMIRKRDITDLLTVGIPSALLSGLLDVTQIVQTKLMSTYGDLSVAAIGLAGKMERLPNSINLGISQGALPIIAYNYSAGNKKRMNETIKVSAIIGICVSIVSIVLLIIFAKPFASFFISTSGRQAVNVTETIALAATFLSIRCIQSPFSFINHMITVVMQGVGFGKSTLVQAFVKNIVFLIPFMYIFNNLFGAQGIAGAIPAAEFLGCIFGIFFVRYLFKREEKLLQH